MKLTLAESSLLKDSIGIISELVTEAQFRATPEALQLTALDPATVAMVDFKLLASAFSEYNVDKEGEHIAINLVNLKQVLRRAGSTDAVTLETADAKLAVTIKGASTRTFHLPLIDFESEKRSLPDIEYTATVTTTSSQLSDAIDDADIVAESVALIAEEKLFTIRAEGDLSKVNIDIPQDEDTKIVVKETIDGDAVETPIKARFSIEYLKKMVQGSKLADKVTLNFRTDHPLKVEYKQLNKVAITFILAPRVEND
ncbi:MAG: proliferating cell nuclear antigen (pcna) [Candidatus Woesearchaeota archaeon]